MGGGAGQARPLDALEGRNRFEEGTERSAVVGVIGRDAERAARFETCAEEVEKDPVEKAALLLLLLGPRIRKVDVERRDGCGSERGLDEEPPVGADDADVGKLRARETLAAESVVRQRPLDPEVVAIGAGLRRGDQEARLAAADLDLERRPPAEERRRIERPSEPELLVR